ncbi:hypothetical protein [Aeromonas caviae]|uniref:hypothetical protein n=1 Tax=Aeromonas caviae TaxID=648 RepID=UPI002B459B31|nr:hypothetical protein [Aeromonas caviae]
MMTSPVTAQRDTPETIRATFALTWPPECHLSISYFCEPQRTEMIFVIRDNHILDLTPVYRAIASFKIVSHAHSAPESIILAGESAVARLSTQSGDVYSIDKRELTRLKEFLQQIPGIRLLYTANVLGHLLKDGSNKQHEFITTF